MTARSRQNRQATIFARDGQCCALCGAGANLTLHHIRPRIIGGTNDHTNLITICGACHRELHAEAERVAAVVLWIVGKKLFSSQRARRPEIHG
jgi:5-methylcytosine-specific restriction endonuclease McrA